MEDLASESNALPLVTCAFEVSEVLLHWRGSDCALCFAWRVAPTTTHVLYRMWPRPPVPTTPAAFVDYLGAFDSDRIFGCVCDSMWAVGLGDDEVQEAEWFGA